MITVASVFAKQVKRSARRYFLWVKDRRKDEKEKAIKVFISASLGDPKNMPPDEEAKVRVTLMIQFTQIRSSNF